MADDVTDNPELLRLVRRLLVGFKCTDAGSFGDYVGRIVIWDRELGVLLKRARNYGLIAPADLPDGLKEVDAYFPIRETAGGRQWRFGELVFSSGERVLFIGAPRKTVEGQVERGAWNTAAWETEMNLFTSSVNDPDFAEALAKYMMVKGAQVYAGFRAMYLHSRHNMPWETSRALQQLEDAGVRAPQLEVEGNSGDRPALTSSSPAPPEGESRRSRKASAMLRRAFWSQRVRDEAEVATRFQQEYGSEAAVALLGEARAAVLRQLEDGVASLPEVLPAKAIVRLGLTEGELRYVGRQLETRPDGVAVGATLETALSRIAEQRRVAKESLPRSDQADRTKALPATPTAAPQPSGSSASAGPVEPEPAGYGPPAPASDEPAPVERRLPRDWSLPGVDSGVPEHRKANAYGSGSGSVRRPVGRVPRVGDTVVVAAKQDAAGGKLHVSPRPGSPPAAPIGSWVPVVARGTDPQEQPGPPRVANGQADAQAEPPAQPPSPPGSPQAANAPPNGSAHRVLDAPFRRLEAHRPEPGADAPEVQTAAAEVPEVVRNPAPDVVRHQIVPSVAR